MTDYHAKTINLVANGLGGWRLWTADDADDPAVVAVPYILAAEHERLMAERDAEIARMRDARILVLPGGLTGVCVGSRFGGWLMRRHPDEGEDKTDGAGHDPQAERARNLARQNPLRGLRQAR